MAENSNKNVEKPEGMNKNYALIAGVLIIILIAALAINSFSFIPGNQNNPNNQTNKNETKPPSDGLPVVRIEPGNLPALGNSEATISLVQFSDYQCPFCSRFFSQTETPLVENYIKTGKVKMYYRDYPLSSIHEKANYMANAARCANEQGKFWEMHDKLFSMQSSWTSLPQAGTAVEGYAKEVGIDVQKFNSCMQTNSYNADIQKDTMDGSTYGVGGTPTTFIIAPQSQVDLTKIKPLVDANPKYFALAKDPNGNYIIMIVGAQPYSVFNQILSAIN